MATIAANLPEVRRIEEAALSSWPALSTTFDRSWVIRVSDGQTGRANSINVLDPADGDDAVERLAHAAEFFRGRRIAPTLKTTPLTPSPVIEGARTLGWRLTGESLVMTKPLVRAERPATVPPGRVSEEWLDAVARCMEITPQKRAAIARKLELLGPPAGFFLARGPDGEPVAALLAVLHGGTVGIMDVGVNPGFRGQGHGGRLIREALAWAAANGARLAWLQVDQANRGAIALYDRLGFSNAYPYAYYREVAS